MRDSSPIQSLVQSASTIGALLAALWLGLPGIASAQQETGEHPGFLAAKGRITFQRYCASCHGAGADGKGSVAQFLKVRPADLTRLREKYDGEFPKELLHQVIDGRKVVRTHGSRDMPIWGEVFQSPLVETTGDETGEERADRKIRELIYFLETVQIPVEGEPVRETAEPADS